MTDVRIGVITTYSQFFLKECRSWVGLIVYMERVAPGVYWPALGDMLSVPIHKPETTTLKRRNVRMSTKPTFEQAQLHLQVYEQRREAKLRQARDWFFKNYHVTSLDDAMRIAPMGSENRAFASMVISYWEQACALLNYDLLNEDLFFETSGEFFGVWESLKPVAGDFRELLADKHSLEHLEKVAQRYEAWSERRSPGHIAALRQFMQQQRTQAAKAKRA